MKKLKITQLPEVARGNQIFLSLFTHLVNYFCPDLCGSDHQVNHSPARHQVIKNRDIVMNTSSHRPLLFLSHFSRRKLLFLSKH